MISIIDKFNKIQSIKKSKYVAGSVERIYEYHENCGKDASGHAPVFVNPVVEQKKSKKSLN